MAEEVALLEAWLEELEGAYETLLRTRHEVYLRAVERRYSLDDGSLPAIVEYHCGMIPPGLLRRYVQATPAVTLEAISLSPGEKQMQGLVDSLLIHIIVRAQTPTDAHKLCERYGLAIISLVRNERPRGVNITGLAAATCFVDQTVLDQTNGFAKQAEVRLPLHVGVVL